MVALYIAPWLILPPQKLFLVYNPNELVPQKYGASYFRPRYTGHDGDKERRRLRRHRQTICGEKSG